VGSSSYIAMSLPPPQPWRLCDQARGILALARRQHLIIGISNGQAMWGVSPTQRNVFSGGVHVHGVATIRFGLAFRLRSAYWLFN
jgi:hypothetical protein